MWDFSRIKNARRVRNMSQEKLAEISGISQATISRLENNNATNVSIEIIGDLAIALNVYAPDLIQLKRKYRLKEEDIFNLNDISIKEEFDFKPKN